jgi:hypothetical protein
MASTRNKNTKEDYCLEKQQNRNFVQYQDYKYSRQNYQPQLPGFGFTPTHVPGNDLSHNYVTIESQLRGIGANDLENPRSVQSPDYIHMTDWDLVKQEPILMPNPLVVEKNQRHNP